MARTTKAKLYKILDETFYPELKEYGITMGYVMQITEDAAVKEFLALNPKMKHGDEVIAIECEMIGPDEVKEGKRWLKEHK